MKSIITLIVVAISALSQTATPPRPSFEIASIKANSTARPHLGDAPGGRFVATGVPLSLLIGYAFPGTRVDFASKPAWVDTDLWDIEAKAPEGSVPPRTKLPDFTKPDTMNLMVQSLLEVRFQMKAHRETRDVPMYEVTVGKGGLKMKLSEDQTPPAPLEGQPAGKVPRGGMRMARGDFQGYAVSMENVLMMVSQLTGRPAVDKTGVTGLYDFHLQWVPDAFTSPLPFEPRGAAAVPAPPPNDPAGPSLVTAIEEQLGLRLQSTKGPLELLIIDSIQKASAN